MGLDMYLTKRTYVKNWEYMTPEQKHQVTVKKNHVKHPHIDPKKISYVIEDAGYWRKANAIHKWFVDNVQEGNDDCREYYVSREQLQELLDTCIAVRDSCTLVEGKVENGYTLDDNLKKQPILEDGKVIVNSSLAEELLPSQSGFFFGGTEYDEYYLEDINHTIEILQKELGIEYRDGFYEPSYYYRSSW